jgi:hypothetical protein
VQELHVAEVLRTAQFAGLVVGQVVDLGAHQNCHERVPALHGQWRVCVVRVGVAPPGQFLYAADNCSFWFAVPVAAPLGWDNGRHCIAVDTLARVRAQVLYCGPSGPSRCSVATGHCPSGHPSVVQHRDQLKEVSGWRAVVSMVRAVDKPGTYIRPTEFSTNVVPLASVYQ